MYGALDTLHDRVTSFIFEKSSVGGRQIFALAGPPASGKSTLAEMVVSSLNQGQQGLAALVPMDGFHLDDQILEDMGRLDRKGAPDTFDAHGLCDAVGVLAKGERDVFLPTFDRAREQAIAGSLLVQKSTRIIVLEGNYLLLNDAPWNQLQEEFSGTVFLSPSLETLEYRLKRRWIGFGYDEQEASSKTNSNDMINARFVLENSTPADLLIE